MAIQWNIPEEDVPLIESKDEVNGLFIICKCCLQFPLIALPRAGRKSGQKQPWRVNVRNGCPFTLGTWNDHKKGECHLRADNVSKDPEKQQHVMKGALPSVTTFFTKKRKDDSTTSTPSIKKKKIDFPTPKPFYKLHCNGVVTTAELLNKNKLHERGKNADVQNGLRVQKRMFVAGFVGCEVGVLPGCDVEILTLYSSGCVKEKIGGPNHDKLGIRCTSCEVVRKKKWTKTGLRESVVSRGIKWRIAECMFDGKAIDVFQEGTHRDVKYIINTPVKHLSVDGKHIISQMKSLLMLQTSKVKGINASSSSIYAQEFIKFFDGNPNFRNSLLGQLVEVTMKRTNGYTTCAIPERLIDFFCLIHMYDPKTAQLISANFLGGRSQDQWLRGSVFCGDRCWE